MTYEEAIKYAKKVNFCCGCPVDMANCDGDECGDCEHRAFFEMAIETLGKQIKKKPTLRNGNFECPECGHWFDESWYVWFCPECGQSIDWSDGE